jgi:glycosyltransferase involved in cell wall biosynthesis
MIIKDEAYFLDECLGAVVPLVDEIVIVDTGSTDGSREVALRYTDRVYDFEWIDDFAAARNYGLERATGDWALVLDADEAISPSDFSALREAMSSDRHDGFYLTARSYTDDSQRSGIHVAAPDDPMCRGYRYYYTYRIMKLFRLQTGIAYAGRIHEIVDASVAESRRGTLDAVLHHYAEANPDRPRAERALRYLAMMEEELAERDDGRLFAIAGATALKFTDRFDKAERYLLRAVELGYDADRSLEGAAEAAYRAGEPGVARDRYQWLYRQGYRTPSVCLNLANLCVRAGDRDQGVRLLRECLALGGLGEEIDAVIQRNIRFLEG